MSFLIFDQNSIEAMDRFNQAIQAEIEQSSPSVAIELAQIKYQINKQFDERKSVYTAQKAQEERV